MSTDEFDVTVSAAYRTPGRRFNNFTAVVAPGVGDDSADGYEVGSRWIDTTAGKEYVCLDDAAGAAVWTETTQAAGVSDSTLHIDLSVSGATTIDRADGATHDLTLTGDATFTLAGAVTGEATDLRLILRQDGTGGWTVTWPGSVEWDGGSAPVLQTDPNALDVIGLVTVDDGTTWLGFHAEGGSAGTPATTVESETTWGITPAVGTDTEYARQDHTHGTPANPVTTAAIAALGFVGPILITDTPSTPLVFADLIQNEAQTDLIYADL